MEEQKRNSGLDIARTAAMCGIIILHIVDNGGLIQCTEGPRYWIVFWIQICATCSVDLFALLSGYFGIDKRTRSLYRTFELLAIVIFYSVVITLIFFAIDFPEIRSVKNLIKGVFPELVGRYWYITCFIPLSICQPYINKGLNALSLKEHRALCGILIVIFSLVSTVPGVDFFKVIRGYSFLWLCICYIVGAYMKREQGISYRRFGFLIGSIVLLVGNYIIYYFKGAKSHYFVEYNSPIILFMSIDLFLLFANLKNVYGREIWKKLSSFAFDVYVLHCHIFVFDFIMKDSFVWISVFSPFMALVIILLCGASIYIWASVVGNVRKYLFKTMGIVNLLNKAADKVNWFIY